MKDRELTRLLQTHPEEGLEAAMLAYAPLVKAVLNRATADAADLVGALVAAMAPPDRDIFLRKYYLLQSGKEIAAALDMSVESVNTRLNRGRDRLRRQLTEKGVYTHA